MEENEISVGYSQRTAGADGLITTTDCIGDPAVVATGANLFAAGAYLYRRDSVTGYSVWVYKNTGTSAAPSWQLQSQVGVITKKVSVTSAEILASNSTPKELVAAPGVGFTVIPISVVGKMSFSSAAYAANTTLQVKFASGADALFSNTSLLPATATCRQPFFALAQAGVTGNDDEYVSNAALLLTTATGNPTTGAGTLEVVVSYAIAQIS